MLGYVCLLHLVGSDKVSWTESRTKSGARPLSNWCNSNDILN